MSQTKPDELHHLARALLIMLLPFEGEIPLPPDTRRRMACREYWNSLGGVDKLCENLRREFAAKYAGVGYRFPKELDALFVELGKLPLRGTIPEDGVIESVCAQVKTQCGLVGETLRRLGESRYNQDNATP